MLAYAKMLKKNFETLIEEFQGKFNTRYEDVL